MKKNIKRWMFLLLFGMLFLMGDYTTEAAKSEGEGYLWKVDVYGNVEIYGVTSLQTATEIIVPAQIDGKDVVRIACDTFTECGKLKRIELPATIRELEDTPFLNLPEMEEIVVAEDNPYFVSIDGCVYSKDLRRLHCVPCAYQGAFVVEPWVTDINGNAFAYCRQIESIYLSYDEKYADRGVSEYNLLNCILNGCSALKKITVAENHPNYSSVDGVLYSKDGKTLITVPPAYEKTIFDVPETVEYLGNDCFADCVYLEKIVLPEGLSEIPDNAFCRCAALKEAVLPEGIERVGQGAFRGCVSLKSVSLPSTVTRIEIETFDDCVSLETIHADGNETGIWQAIEEQTAWSSGEKEGNTPSQGEQPEVQAPTQEPSTESVVSVTEPQADWLTRQRVQKGTTITFSYQVTIENKVIITGLTPAAEKEKQMRKLVVPQKINGMQVVGIDGGAFAKIPLTEVLLPEGLQEIGKGAFYGCNLTEISIPESVCYIAPRAFGANYGMKKITVAEKNRTYCSVNGVLYTKHMTMLCQVPANYRVTTFVLPEEVLLIEEYAFGNNRHIVEIYRAAGMPKCREKAFWNMENYTA